MALIALIHQKAPGSTVELANLMFVMILPVFMIGPIAGVYVDRWNRKHIMIISDILRGLLVLLIPVCIVSFKSILPIYLIIIMTFSVTRFFLSSKMAIIPSIVPREDLLIANSLSDTTRMIAAIISLGLAGILVKCLGVLGSFYVDSATFFISALFLSSMSLESAGSKIKEKFVIAEKAIKDAIKSSIFKDIKNGFRYFIELKDIRFVGFVFFLLMSGLGAIFCVIIVFIQDAFKSATADLGLLGMFLGIGLFTGVILYGRFGQKLAKSRVVFTNLALSGVMIIAFTISIRAFHSLGIAAALSVVMGLFIGPIIVSSNTLVHEALPEKARGRVFSSLEVIMHLGFLVFMFTASFLAESIDRMWILVFVGGIFSLLGVGGGLLNRKLRSK